MKTFETDPDRSLSHLALVAGTTILAIAGCDASEDGPAHLDAAQAVQEAQEAVDTTAQYTETRGRELVDRAQQTIEETREEIATARDKLDTLPDEASEALGAAIARAETARQALDAELDALREAGAERWAAAQDRVSNALTEIAEARREIEAAVADSADA